MKMKHAIILLVIGYCIDFWGGLQKILHTPYADGLLTIAALTKIIACILLLYKILTHPKAKEFLNW